MTDDKEHDEESIARSFYEQIKERRGLFGLPDLHACSRVGCPRCGAVVTLTITIKDKWWDRLCKKAKCLSCGVNFELQGVDPIFDSIVRALDHGKKTERNACLSKERIMQSRIEKLERHKRSLIGQIRKQSDMLKKAGIK